MKKLIFIFLILLIAIGLGFLIERDAGYVLIAYDQWTIETSLWVALTFFILAFIVLYILIRLVKHVRLFPHKLQKYSSSRNKQKHLLSMKEGLHHLASGHWALAEKHLVNAAQKNQSPMLNYLAAARAAHKQKCYSDRDKYLTLAEKQSKDNQFAAKLTRAQLYIESEQWPAAIQLLTELNSSKPKHHQVLQLLVLAYQATNNWKDLHQLLPTLKKAKVFSQEKLTELTLQNYHNLLLNPFETLDDLIACWQQMPKALQANHELIEHYCQQLFKFKAYSKLQDTIETFLKKNWNSKLVEWYGIILVDNPDKQIKKALDWLAKHPNDPHLQLTLGRLYRRANLWGKAKEYLHLCLQQYPTPETYYEYALVSEELHDFKTALEFYRMGLAKVLPVTLPVDTK